MKSNNIPELNKAYLNKIKLNKKNKKNYPIFSIFIIFTFISLVLFKLYSDDSRLLIYVIFTFGIFFIMKKLITFITDDTKTNYQNISISASQPLVINRDSNLNTYKAMTSLSNTNSNINTIPVVTNIMQSPVNTIDNSINNFKTFNMKNIERSNNNTSTYNENFDISSPKRFMHDIIKPNISYTGLIHRNTIGNIDNNNPNNRNLNHSTSTSIYNSDTISTSHNTMIDNNTTPTWHTYQSSPVQDSPRLLRYNSSRFPNNSINKIQSPVDCNDKNSTSSVLKEMIKRISSPEKLSTKAHTILN